MHPKLFVAKGDCMEPDIVEGDILLLKKASRVHPGRIYLYRLKGRDLFFAHRAIFSLTIAGKNLVVALKGDNANAIDFVNRRCIIGEVAIVLRDGCSISPSTERFCPNGVIAKRLIRQIGKRILGRQLSRFGMLLRNKRKPKRP